MSSTGTSPAETPQYLQPDWPAPAQVHAISSCRGGGFSQPPFASLNLGLGSGDARETVLRNRDHLGRAVRMPAMPCWLQQVHGTRCVAAHAGHGERADASFTDRPDTVCVVMTADCLPVLFASRDGRRVAAAHAGWRGLAGGVLESTVAAMGCAPATLLAWLGPAIGAGVYEVGDEVRDAFCAHDRAARQAFVESRPGHWLADLHALARQRLAALGIGHISATELCTYSAPERFFSYRRDGATGRMASFVWIESGPTDVARGP